MKGHNFHVMQINQLKKISKGRSFGTNQVAIDTNILNIQIKACTCLVGYYPLSLKFTPTKEITSNPRESLYGQFAPQGQHYDKKSSKIN